MQETVKNIELVLKRRRIDSENRSYSETISGMNTKRSLVEVGAHISSERSGATGKTGTVKDILDLNRKHIKKGSGLDEF